VCSFFKAGVKIVDFLEDMCSRQEVPFEMKEFAEHLYTLLTSLEGECFAIMKVSQLGRQEWEGTVHVSIKVWRTCMHLMLRPVLLLLPLCRPMSVVVPLMTTWSCHPSCLRWSRR
jgi:hypothetical protein